MNKDKIKKRAEWTQLLEGATIIKWWRRPILKLRMYYWKMRNNKTRRIRT